MYKEKINELMKSSMTERGYKLWYGINSKLPDVWDKSTSSTFKYHKRADGSVPSIAEHTFEMLYAGYKIISMFGVDLKTKDSDIILMSIALHDGLKYGEDGIRKHTLREHDSLMANVIENNKTVFLELYSESQVSDLIDSIRFHSGRWSKDADINTFNFNDRTPIAMLTHTLDMLSSKDCLKI